MQTRSRSASRMRLADEEAVVEDVVVRQRRALGRAGGAAGELDVDRIVELQLSADLARAACARRRSRPCDTSSKRKKPRLLVGADADQRGQAPAGASPASAPGALRSISGASSRSMPT